MNPIESENNLLPTISAATSSSSMKSEVLHDEGVVSGEETEVAHDVREKNEKRTGRTVENTENETEKIIKYKEEEKSHIRSRQSDHTHENIGGEADGGSDDDFKIISNDNDDLSNSIYKSKKDNNSKEKEDDAEVDAEVEVVKSSSNAPIIPSSSSSFLSSSSSSSRDCAVSESDSTSCHCPICYLNISSLSESKRTFHVNGCCIDSTASTSILKNVSTPKKQSKSSSSHEKNKPSDGKKVKLKSDEGRGEGMKKGRIDNYFYASPT